MIKENCQIQLSLVFQHSPRQAERMIQEDPMTIIDVEQRNVTLFVLAVECGPSNLIREDVSLQTDSMSTVNDGHDEELAQSGNVSTTMP